MDEVFRQIIISIIFVFYFKRRPNQNISLCTPDGVPVEATIPTAAITPITILSSSSAMVPDPVPMATAVLSPPDTRTATNIINTAIQVPQPQSTLMMTVLSDASIHNFEVIYFIYLKFLNDKIIQLDYLPIVFFTAQRANSLSTLMQCSSDSCYASRLKQLFYYFY